ncbi:MAG: methylmalonyl Co-A mutase-associated GTPase MeaB [Candidatus Aminicenantes bacterium]|nr:MAG: methylmalonyl Co-A mutase-associated GTPase MeaB [Candidatus Aminicenantes bacterium]
MSDLAQEVIKGNHRAIAQAISLVENNRSAAQEMMKKIFAHTGESIIVGITGSPGSGKSTLVDQMAGILRKNKKKIGIIAVDPSSPFSGGAILGDRIRMMQHSVDPEIFIRSMATRGHLGGLAKATGEAISVLEAAGKDFILVETVGVGQDEVEVVKLADIILVILIPGAGDEIQVFKAGIMEIADIFILNKADSSLADRTEKQLKAMLDLGLVGKTPPPVIKTVATEGKGVDKLIKEIDKLVMDRNQELRDSRKKRLIPWMLMDIISEKIYHSVTQDIKASEFEEFIERIHKREIDPYTVADKIVGKLKKSI